MTENSKAPWNEPNDHGELSGDICCQRACGDKCYEHDPDNYPEYGGDLEQCKPPLTNEERMKHIVYEIGDIGELYSCY